MTKKASSKKRKASKDDVEVSVTDETIVETDDAAAPAKGEDTHVDESVIQFESDGRYRNKQRCLVLCSRGVTARYRHLLEDLRTLLPHHKKESKLDPGSEGAARAVNDIAEMRSCNSVLFLECRKRQDAYLWMGKVGQSAGPSVRFHVTNIHTMDELRLTGNCMKGSRPVLSFDESFARLDHLKILKELFVDVFGTPRGHPKSKPFVDRVMAFYYADNKIWVRNYQILEQQASNALEARLAKKQSGQDSATSLVEIGPRFVLNPVRIFRGSFGGQTLYRNPDFVSPNEIRAAERRNKGSAYMDRKNQQKRRKIRKEELVVPEDPLDSVFR
jgi:ribosome biogenesis protein BRX1